MAGRVRADPTENCPKDLGPDFDFGAPPILQILSDGARAPRGSEERTGVRSRPDDRGKLLWKAALVKKIGESEILFGARLTTRPRISLDNGSVGALDPPPVGRSGSFLRGLRVRGAG